MAKDDAFLVFSLIPYRIVHYFLDATLFAKSCLFYFLISFKMKRKISSKKEVSMPVVNPHAAGIDVGSRSHFVATGQGADDWRLYRFVAQPLPIFTS